MTLLGEVADEPGELRRALASLRGVALRPEVALEETPAPRRLAPHAVAFSADVTHDGLELAAGRLVLLHDPEGQEGWEGIFRLVSYLRAELEPEITADPLLASVGWAWLVESLDTHRIAYAALSGTITRSASESFGVVADRPATTEIEIRASWTPTEADLRPHVEAWCDVLCVAAGLPPVPPGVTPLRRGPAW